MDPASVTFTDLSGLEGVVQVCVSVMRGSLLSPLDDWLCLDHSQGVVGFDKITFGDYGGVDTNVTFEVYLCMGRTFEPSSACALVGVALEQESQSHYEVSGQKLDVKFIDARYEVTSFVHRCGLAMWLGPQQAIPQHRVCWRRF